jgi:DNA-binding transcriptional MerR regulator/methylmalonyl-CoA mutase cobalamin-binding subunit
MAEQALSPTDYSQMPKYKIGAVSRLTGLSADVVRVWERRYQAITPQRSDGGSRLYSDAEIARLRKLRQAVEFGHAISQIAKLPDAELENLTGKHKAAQQSAGETGQWNPGNPYDVTRERFLEAIARMEVVVADELIYRAATLYPPRVMVKNIVAPLLEEIGERWAHRDFGVAEEHVATNLIRNLISSMFRLYSPSDGNRAADAIVLATPAGERHEFGILIGALIAAMHGWRVIYLGADLPAAEIVRTVKLTKARVLALSVLTPENLETGRELKAIADHIPQHARVWIGGEDAPNHRALIEQANWILVRDFEDLDDRLKR